MFDMIFMYYYYSGSNFCIGYGTRQSMRSFVKMDSKKGFSQSLYTKYLLQHLTTKNISVGSMFEKLNCSFTMNEDASIVAQMKPEFKDSTRQTFCLSAPLRHVQASAQHQKFFKMTRFEALALNSLNFEANVTVQLGLAWSYETDTPKWIQGKTYQAPEMMVKLSIEPSIFLNEAYLVLSVKFCNVKWVQDSCLQIVALNVPLSMEQTEESKKSENGLVFPLDEVFENEKGFQIVEKCHLSGLQRVPDPVLKFRVYLLYRGCPIQCKGVINFPVPICQNMPNLKLSNGLF